MVVDVITSLNTNISFVYKTYQVKQSIHSCEQKKSMKHLHLLCFGHLCVFEKKTISIKFITCVFSILLKNEICNWVSYIATSLCAKEGLFGGISLFRENSHMLETLLSKMAYQEVTNDTLLDRLMLLFSFSSSAIQVCWYWTLRHNKIVSTCTV